VRDGEGDNFHSDPMKSPLFECFLRLHQLSFICSRIPEEYQKLIQEDDQEQKEDKQEIKEETESEDSFLSADMSSDDNVMTQRIVEENQISEVAIDKEGKGI
jgi:hypothetical protein